MEEIPSGSQEVIIQKAGFYHELLTRGPDPVDMEPDQLHEARKALLAAKWIGRHFPKALAAVESALAKVF